MIRRAPRARSSSRPGSGSGLALSPTSVGSRRRDRAASTASAVGARRRRRASCASGTPRVWAPPSLLVVLGWWWASARLDALDRSPLQAEIGRAGRACRRDHGDRATDRRPATSAPGRATASKARPSTSAVSSSSRSAARRRRARSSRLSPSSGAPRGPRARVRRAHLASPPRRPRRPARGRVEAGRARAAASAASATACAAGSQRASAPGLAGERRAVLEGIVLGDDAGLHRRAPDELPRAGPLPPARRLGPERRRCVAGGRARCSPGCWRQPRWSGELGALAGDRRVRARRRRRSRR